MQVCSCSAQLLRNAMHVLRLLHNIWGRWGFRLAPFCLHEGATGLLSCNLVGSTGWVLLTDSSLKHTRSMLIPIRTTTLYVLFCADGTHTCNTFSICYARFLLFNTCTRAGCIAVFVRRLETSHTMIRRQIKMRQLLSKRSRQSNQTLHLRHLSRDAITLSHKARSPSDHPGPLDLA